KSEIKGEIFLSAHYDTKSSRIKSWKKLTAGSLLGTLIYYLIVIISSIFRLIDHNSIVADILDIIYLLISFLVVPVLIILLYNKLINESPGACDNGSGVAIILKLAEIYNQEKLKNSKITVIFTGAEEVGMFGMKKYMKDHRDHLDEIKNHWYQINIDMVGSEIGYFNSKSEKIPENKVLNNLIKEIAEEKNIKLNPFFASMLSGEEHEPFLKAGFETCDFTSHADIPNIHSAKDTMEKVNPEKLNQAIELIKEMIKRIDSKYILESLNLEK
ncbi:MAG: Zn-dependent exopeptidase M28, partial [archaeon]|nr:Zn-dependent exopeptidase M28 [archaeon]